MSLSLIARVVWYNSLMIFVRQYESVDAIRQDWEAVEDTVFHYPFQCFWYIEFFAKKFYQTDQLFFLGIFDDTSPLAFGAFAVNGTIAEFVGMKQLTSETTSRITDYPDILYSTVGSHHAQAIWQVLRDFFKEKKVSLLLEFIRNDSPTARVSGFITKEQEEVAPYLLLPKTFDAYLQMLSRKDRHELRRKLRHAANESVSSYVVDGYEERPFHEFIRLHKMSRPEKNAFMSEKMEQIFMDLVMCQKKHWIIQFAFLKIHNVTVASAMYYVNAHQSLLYNSGFNPAFSHLSVGLVLQGLMIERSIQEQKQVYDFLRGNGTYKYRLGAVNIPLFRIQMT